MQAGRPHPGLTLRRTSCHFHLLGLRIALHGQGYAATREALWDETPCGRERSQGEDLRCPQPTPRPHRCERGFPGPPRPALHQLYAAGQAFPGKTARSPANPQNHGISFHFKPLSFPGGCSTATVKRTRAKPSRSSMSFNLLSPQPSGLSLTGTLLLVLQDSAHLVFVMDGKIQNRHTICQKA